MAMSAEKLLIVCTVPPTNALATPPWTPFHQHLVAHMSLRRAAVATTPSPSPADFLVVSPGPPTAVVLSFVCISSAQDMDAALTREAQRIGLCIEQYGLQRTSILVMIQPGHASCLQTIERFLFHDIATNTLAGLDVSTTTPIGVDLARHSTVTVGSRTSAQSLTASLTGVPYVAVCHSSKDAIDFITHLLDQDHRDRLSQTTARSSLRVQEQQKEEKAYQSSSTYQVKADAWSSWLVIATLTHRGSLVTTQESHRLRMGLGTIQTLSLASSGHLRSSCLLKDSVARSIEAYFETDQPI